MTYFNLYPYVFFIRGALKSTIYDSKKGNIFSLSEEATNIIHSLVKDSTPLQKIYKKSESKKIKEFLNTIIDNNLGNYCNKTKPQKINKIKPKHFISIIWYEVTNLCNLRCLHCYDNSSPASSNDFALNIDQEIDMLHQASLYSDRFQFIGGEPFLELEKIKCLIQVARTLFKKVEIFTNGTLMYNHDDIFKFISDNNVSIALSLYSHIPKIHDSITSINGSYHKTMQTITKLQKYRIPFRIATVILKQNIHSIDETKRQLRDKWGIQLRTSTVRLTGRANGNLIDDNIIKKKLITLNQFRLPYSFKKFAFNLNYHNCYGKKLYIANNGDVYPCVMDREKKIGNITEQKMVDIIENTAYKECISMNKDRITICKDCEFRYYCHDCRPDAIYNQQSFLSKPWNCTYNPYIGQWNNKKTDQCERS